MKTKLFKEVAAIYLPESAKPMDIEEYTHRGCTVWVFKRSIRKWAPTSEGMNAWRKGSQSSRNEQVNFPYNEMPEQYRRYWVDEFWMGISDYFLTHDVEFEETVEKTIGESLSKDEAKYRINHFIDKHYAEIFSIEKDIM